jgi:hypothetical protein
VGTNTLYWPTTCLLVYHVYRLERSQHLLVACTLSGEEGAHPWPASMPLSELPCLDGCLANLSAMRPQMSDRLAFSMGSTQSACSVSSARDSMAL